MFLIYLSYIIYCYIALIVEYILVTLFSDLWTKFNRIINSRIFKESLILAQDERWRYALYMQVVREFLTQVADG